MAEGLWEGVDRLLDRLDPELVGGHGLGPLAARRLRLLGEPVPERLLREERGARTAALVAPALLARAQAAHDEPFLLVKGPELALRYPDSARRFGDLDLVATDAERAQRALLAAGFQLQDGLPPFDYARHHHLHPLVWPGLALRIEVHRSVTWPHGLPAPSNDELFEASVPASFGVDGLVVPHPDHHALLIASHTWEDVPMQKLRELVDVLVFTEDDARERLGDLARRWGFGRGWEATLAAADWLLRDGPEPGFVRVWGRYLRFLREPTVFELHLQEWLSPFSLARPGVALRLALAAGVRDLRPAQHETWQAKLQRARRAVTRPFASQSAHERRSGKRA